MIRHAQSHVLISFDIARWLQSMQRGAGECYSDCLAETHCKQMDEIAKMFERRQRLPMTDGDGAVEKAERFIDRGSLSVKCVAHRTANTFAEVFKPWEDMISFV
eukprot:7083841-Pyramimonas_sp.AAC.1